MRKQAVRGIGAFLRYLPREPGIFMTYRYLISIVFCAALLAAQNIKAASTAFDGSWSVTIDFKAFKNPDGSTARPTVRRLVATVKNGVLHGELGTHGALNYYQLDGKIEADGSAILRTTGITGNPDYTAASTHPRSGVPYEYQVIAHFSARSGTGHSVSDPPRPRIFTFTKE